MAENGFKNTVETLFKGMDSFITSKTVVGDPIKVDDDTLIIPLIDISFAVGAGAMAGSQKNNGGGGMGGKMTPSSVIVINKGNARLINIKNQDGITKILDMVPDLLDRFTGDKKEKREEGKSEESNAEE
ncbi:MAG: GerW family sporulation protein [Lachnospiraceae bacterium]|jgi:uncharacterized spore protein YtfJ